MSTAGQSTDAQVADLKAAGCDRIFHEKVSTRTPEENRIQLQAFAATKNEGLWATTLRALADGIGSQGGEAEELKGLLGPELHASVPAIAGQTKVMRQSVFVGVDGPRWFL
ncbi:MAG: DUF3710 domain-containing protein, partial [Actinobacteria bacterium]|nr:DUF3710 domain-containing protein [Actinomycetota bacterium]